MAEPSGSGTNRQGWVLWADGARRAPSNQASLDASWAAGTAVTGIAPKSDGHHAQPLDRAAAAKPHRASGDAAAGHRVRRRLHARRDFHRQSRSPSDDDSFVGGVL